MFALTKVRHKRPRTPYVVKYLEGIPTPTTLLDHLAGADLVAGGNRNAPFFSTVPRYIDCSHEHRLSKLFFHHVLYPAGGARKPTQAVVVRGGRSVVPCRPRHIRGGTRSGQKSPESPRAQGTVLSPAAAAVNPLAVPAAQLGAGPSASPTNASLFSPEQPLYNGSHWSRSDPARTSYFYAPHTSRNRDSGKGYAFEPGSPRVRVAPPLRYERANNSAAGSLPQRGGDLSPEDDSALDTVTEGSAAPLRRRRSYVSSLMPYGAGGDAHDDGGTRMAGDGRGQRVADGVGADPVMRRSITDEGLAALRGVIEAAFAARPQRERTEVSSPRSPTAASAARITKLAELAVNPSAGLVQLREEEEQQPHHNTDDAAFSFQPARDGNAESATEGLAAWIEEVCRRHARSPTIPNRGGAVSDAATTTLPTAPFVAYLQTRLPPDSVVSLPVAHASTQGDRGSAESKQDDGVLVRLAGGVEPLVNFAVGAPLLPSGKGQTAGGDDACMNAFSFLTCLLRVEGGVPVAATDAGRNHLGSGSGGHPRHGCPDADNDSGADMDASQGGSRPPAAHLKNRAVAPSLEPWRLGGPALDLAVPYMARTVSEASPKPASPGTTEPLLLGRSDCECYLIPQRELLLSLYVPPSTQALCEQQNKSRLAKQVKLGHASAVHPHRRQQQQQVQMQGEEEEEEEGWGGPRYRAFLSPSLAKQREGEGNSSSSSSSEANEYDAAIAAHYGFMQERSEAGRSTGGPGSEEADGWVVPSEHQRLTSGRLLARQLANAEAAMSTGLPGQGVAAGVLRGRTEEVNGKDEGGAALSKRASLTKPSVRQFEVRALPGDVIYIPCGWAYSVRRIVGTAVVDLAAAAAADGSSSPHSGGGGSSGTHLFSNRSLVLSRTKAAAKAPSVHAAPLEESCVTGSPATAAAAAAAPRPVVTNVSLDAFLLNYKPYPFLSKEQAAVYLSANYAHGGIEEFYEKGGNPLFYKYE